MVGSTDHYLATNRMSYRNSMSSSKPPRIDAPSRFTPAHDASLHRSSIRSDKPDSTPNIDDNQAEPEHDAIVDNPTPPTKGGWPLPM